MRLPTKPDDTPVYIFNPLKEDFLTTFAYENNSPAPYLVRSKELVQFPKYLALHIGKKIIQKIALADESGLAYEEREKKAREEVFVTL